MEVPTEDQQPGSGAVARDIRKPILVTGAAGETGSVGFKIVRSLREKNLPVRAMVRRIDERSTELEKLGAEVVRGDLTDLQDVIRVMGGCERIYFGMSASPAYLEATTNVAAVAKSQGVQVLINMSQMTVSSMSLTETTESPQHKLHWLCEQVLNWSGVPVVHIRPTVFLENPFFYKLALQDIRQHHELRLPFGTGKTSPIATDDVARVITTILLEPSRHIGKVYELTGPLSQDVHGIAQEFSLALDRQVVGIDVPLTELLQNPALKSLPEHIQKHIATMAKLHREGRYDRMTSTVQELTGVAPTTVQQWVRNHRTEFQ
eukprot:GILJ01014066.1.p1 GENE.GILJ01014066.1~~GILJ01014066.1.p1  ORF type:complete len:319 (-),score=28.80 GILJ01014066.1:29-985(-)